MVNSILILCNTLNNDYFFQKIPAFLKGCGISVIKVFACNLFQASIINDFPIFSNISRFSGKAKPFLSIYPAPSVAKKY